MTIVCVVRLEMAKWRGQMDGPQNSLCFPSSCSQPSGAPTFLWVQLVHSEDTEAGKFTSTLMILQQSDARLTSQSKNQNGHLGNHKHL